MAPLSKTIDYKKLAGAIALCEITGIVAGFFTINAVKNFCILMRKPGFDLPEWILGPLWSLVYLLMGIAFYNVLKHRVKSHANYKSGIILFWVQLVLNLLWIITLFGLKDPFLAFLVIVLLITALCFWMLQLQKIHKTSALLQIPYLLWCCFVIVLNYYIIHPN